MQCEFIMIFFVPGSRSTLPDANPDPAKWYGSGSETLLFPPHIREIFSQVSPLRKKKFRLPLRSREEGVGGEAIKNYLFLFIRLP